MTMFATLENYCYAGWNTDGNTIGTVVANAIILNLYGKAKPNAAFNSLRILEDFYYQAGVRQDLIQYVNQISMQEGENIENLAPDISFYERFVYKVLNFKFNSFSYLFQPHNFTLSDVYFPWNRTFEIGLELNEF